MLNDIGVDFVSVKDNLDLSTSTGRLMAHIIGAFAEFEAAIITERVIARLCTDKSNGKLAKKEAEWVKLGFRYFVIRR